jgi:hypothetical protein
MGNTNAKRDDNWQPVIMGETDDASRETSPLVVDPITKRLKVTATVSDNALPIGAATSAKQDDIIAKLPLNEVGRLKTSNLPADITPVTGTITANAQTIPVSTDRVSNVMAHCYGTFSTVNCTFEGSLNSTNGTDGNWFTIQAVRTNTNTVETATGNLSAAPAYGWELSVNALRYMRVRATAFTSGTQNWVFTLGSYATEPIPAIQTHAVTVGSASTSIGKAEDGASANGNVGVPPMIVRADTLQANAGVSANGDYAFMFGDVNGRLYTNSMITGKTGDDTYQTPRIDSTTHTLQTMDYSHHEVHGGSYFRSSMNYTLANGEVATVGFTTPNTAVWCHMTWFLETTADGTFTVLEDVTSFTGGVAVTPLNHNRNSLNPSTMTLIRGMTGSDLVVPTGGTTILNAVLSTGKGSEISAGHGEEFILKQNSKYLFRYTNGTSANVIRFVMEWYEHTNKTA